MWNNGNSDDDEEVNELCENLYKVSARCDQHYRSWSSKTKQSKEELAKMQLSCDFIDSVVMGNYDEMGFVKLFRNDSSYNPEGGGKNNILKNSIYYEEYGHFVQEVTAFQVFGLCASMALCSMLAVWSFALNRSLQQGKPWRLGRRFNIMSLAKRETPDVMRQESGIALTRSLSGGSYYMT